MLVPLYVDQAKKLEKSESYFLADGGLGVDDDASCEDGEEDQVEIEPKLLERGNSILKFVQTPLLKGKSEDYDLADGGLGVESEASEDEAIPRGFGNLAKGVVKLVRSLSGFNKIDELDVFIGGDSNDEIDSEISSVQ